MLIKRLQKFKHDSDTCKLPKWIITIRTFRDMNLFGVGNDDLDTRNRILGALEFEWVLWDSEVEINNDSMVYLLIHLLGLMKGSRIVKRLMDIFKSQDNSFSYWSYRALKNIEGVDRPTLYVRAIQKKDPWFDSLLEWRWGDLKDEQDERIFSELLKLIDTEDEKTATQLVEEFEYAPEAAYKYVFPLLTDDNQLARKRALEIFIHIISRSRDEHFRSAAELTEEELLQGWLLRKEAIEGGLSDILRNLIKENDVEILASAAGTVRIFRLYDNLKDIKGVLDNESADVRRKALFAFWFLDTGKEEAKKIYLAAFRDEDDDVIDAAVEIAENLKLQEAVDPLLELLDKSDKMLRSHAISALGEIGDKKAIPHLEKFLDSNDYLVAYYAKEAIAKIKGEED